MPTMKKNNYNSLVLLLSYVLTSISLQGANPIPQNNGIQKSIPMEDVVNSESAISIVKSTVLTNSIGHDLEARDFIKFTPGFKFTAIDGKSLYGHVDQDLVFPTTYQAETNYESRTLDKSLPVGCTPMTIDVTPTGASVCQIPIMIAPGTGGMEPSLVISYNSQSSGGLLGIGWNLGGISAITRIPANYYNDDMVDEIDFDNNDRLAIDGNRLIAISGDYGADGTEYRTENESFQKIISYGNINGFPQKFKVWNKDGYIVEYGFTTDSRNDIATDKILAWYINKVTDRSGNYILYTYSDDINQSGKSQLHPVSIDYTGNSNTGLAPYNSIKFLYESKTENKNLFVNGISVTDNIVLRTIQVTNENSIVREYRFKYTQTNGLSHLTELYETGTDGKRLNATTFNWTYEADCSQSVAIPTQATYHNIVDDGYANYSAKFHFGDFNGDGTLDFLITPDATKGATWTGWRMYHGSSIPKGQFRFIGSGNMSESYDELLTFDIIDVNSDGKSDIVYTAGRGPFNSDNGYYWTNKIFVEFANSNGTTFNSSVLIDTYQIETYYLVNKALGKIKRVLSGNFKGNGEVDILFKWTWYSGAPGVENYTTSGNVGSSFIDLTNWGEKTETGSFNDNNLNDVFVTYTDSLRIYEYNHHNEAGGLIFNKLFSTTLIKGSLTHWLGDFNGDGKVDILQRRSDNKLEIFLSTGTSLAATSSPTTFTIANADNVYPGDFNGDGRTDIMYIDGANVRHTYLANVNGQGFTEVSSGAGIAAGNRIFVHDFDNDGRDDIMFTDNTEPYWGGYEVYLTKQNKGDFVGTVTDGNGVVTRLTYSSITNPTVYEAETNATYPLKDVKGEMMLVSSKSVLERVDLDYDLYEYRAVNSDWYKYIGGKVHLAGKGFLGFTSIESRSSINSFKTIQYFSYDNDFFVPDLTKVEVLRWSNNISSKTYTNQISDLGNKRYIIQNSSLTETDNITGITQTSTRTFDSYGNTLTSSITGTGVTKSTVNTYSNDDTNWLLGKLTRSVVTQTRTSQPDYVRTNEYVYNSRGLLTTEKIEPSSTKGYQNLYEYNSFGNITKTTIKPGSSTYGETDRVTSYTFDSKGRFALSTTNPLGWVTTAEFNSKTGKTTKSTDANGLVTEFYYDGFGRTVKTVMPDKSIILASTTWSASTDCENALYYTTVKEGNLPAAKDYFDRYGRLLRHTESGFNGTIIYSDTKYNNIGQIEGKSKPYFAGGTPDWVNYTYDTYGRKSTETGTGLNISYSYSGLKTTITDNINNRSYWELKDETGSLVQSHDNGGTIQFTYYASGKPKEIMHPGGEKYLMEYDIMGNQSKLNDPDAGISLYEYNVFGELTKQTDPSNNILNITYDNLGRKLTSSGAAGTTTFAYDASGAKGFPASINGPSDMVSFEYDALGRQTTITETVDGTNYISSATYDSEGRTSNLTYPGGFSVRYEYNSNGFLNKIVNATSNSALWTAGGANEVGLFESYTLGSNLTTNVSYNNDGYIETIKTGTIQDMSYNFNSLGNLLYRKNNKRNLQEDFTYDNLNRLTSSKVTNQPQIDISYSDNGNILSKTNIGNYSYNGIPHAVSTVAGCSTFTPSTQEYAYNSAGKINNLTDNSLAYDIVYGVNGQRRKITSPAYNKIYTSGGLYEKQNNSDGSSREVFYITTPTGLIGAIVKSGTQTNTYFFLKDHLGSIQYVTNASGTVLEELNFDAWGRRRNATNGSYSSVPTAFLFNRGFTGHEHLDEFGLINMNNRMYDPYLGTFLSPDNYVQDPAFTQAYNRFSYCLNNPLRFTDPSGNQYTYPQTSIPTYEIPQIQIPQLPQITIPQVQIPTYSFDFSSYNYSYSSNYYINANNYFSGYNYGGGYSGGASISYGAYSGSVYSSMSYNYGFYSYAYTTNTSITHGFGSYSNFSSSISAQISNGMQSYSANYSISVSTNMHVQYTTPNVQAITEQTNRLLNSVNGLSNYINEAVAVVGAVATTLDYASAINDVFSEFKITIVKSSSALGKVMGSAGYFAAGAGTYLDYQSMKSGVISGNRFSYRTAGTIAAIGVSYFIAAVPATIVGGGVIAGEQVFDGLVFCKEQILQYCNDFNKAVNTGSWYPVLNY